MDQSTTALDVLSHAATLVEAKGTSNETEQKNMDCRTSPLKELPTREHKLKRSKDRRELPATAPLRIRVKGDNCLSQVSSDNEADKEGLTFTENSLSPVSGEQSSLIFSSTYSNNMDNFTHLHNRHHDSGNGNKTLKESSCLPHFFSDQQPFIPSDDDNDQPLDMSKKCSWHSNQPSAVTNDASSQIKIQQHRPSVITCASALLRTQCNLKDPVHHNYENPDETSFKRNQRQNCSLSSDSDSNECTTSEEARPGHRREILSGMCDPVIEEHFRRSLGKDYSNIFSTSATSVSVTVDDHFAKALGETWLRLQQPKPPMDLVTSTSSSAPPSSAKVPAQSQASSSFLQHSPSSLHSLQCVEEIA